MKKRLLYPILSLVLALSTIFSMGLPVGEPVSADTKISDKPVPTLTAAAPYEPYQGHRPTNEERQAAGLAAKIARAQAAANGIAQPQMGPMPGMTPDYYGQWGNFAYSPLPSIDVSGTVMPGTGMRKFVDGLPQLGPGGANDLGQYVSVAHPDTNTYPGSDYYEIAVVQFTEQMHADLPPTTVRGYVQLNNGTDQTVGSPTFGQNVIAPDPAHYLGPTIVATANTPVRVKFTNLLPTTASGGHLFLPVDTTIMGAGMGPNGGMEMYPDNRATIHLHGGRTPWVSDGTPHQWVAPNLQSAINTPAYVKGASVQDVPDMPVSPGGSVTFYFTNQQSARLMFYHDHAYGETRLNVYDGIAAGYLVTDTTEAALINGTAIPGGGPTFPAGTLPDIGIPLIIQDKTFVPQQAQMDMQDPTWDTTKWGAFGSLWYPHVYMPNQNPFDPAGVTAMGRWDYGPWFGIPGILNGPVVNPYFDPVNAPWEPPQIPGVPDISSVAETFLDTPLVNGTAYPTLTVDPKAYRFRMLSAGNDRTWNLSLFEAAPLTIGITQSGSGYTSVPSVNINGGSVTGAAASALLGVVDIPIVSGGSGYFSAPKVTISGGGGVGATAEAIMAGTSVSSIMIITQGWGYTSVPSVSIAAPSFGGTPASATAKLGVVKINITSRGTASAGAIVNPTITIGAPPAGGTPAAAVGSVLSDVSMVPAVANPGIPFPSDWVIATDGPNVLPDILDGRQGGVPDPTYMGPNWIQIGNEGGFLPMPVDIAPSPIGYQHNNKNATWNNVSKKSLLMAPAERADVIVDFSAYRGKTLIVYNDAPAPTPMFDVRNDLYTGDQDQTVFGGAPTTIAGYGPNTRTVMQIRVNDVTATPYDRAALDTAIPAAYGASQPPPIVPQSAYSTAFSTPWPDDYVRVLDNQFSPAASGQGVASVVVTVNNLAAGFITSPPSVILSGGGGTGAMATATMAPRGSVTAFLVGNGGSGYTSPPTITLTGGGGAGAVGRAFVTAGQVVRVDVINAGANYTLPPTVTLTGGGGTGAQVSAEIGIAFIITAPGTGYTAVPTVALSAPPAGGTQATATAYLGISSVTLVTAGNYPSYTTPPTITVTGGGGTGALLVPVMALNPTPGLLGGGATVAGVTVLDPGAGYTTLPVITFSGGGAGSVQATATAVLGVSGIRVVNPGAGYLTPPTVTITGGGATAVGATATAINNTLTTGLIGSVSVTNPGSGYTTAPQVTFVGGGSAANAAVAYATLTNTRTYDLQPKLVFAGFERWYGRLDMLEGAGLTANSYADPVTEVWQDSVNAGSPTPGDGTQIWKITHIGVDTHPLHWHLFDLQVVNRIQIDGVINPPDPNELGWRETVRLNPFESLIVAARPISPKMNFALPDSIRPLSPIEPLNMPSQMFTNALPNGTIVSNINTMTNFGYEYVWHCHILSHEECDMMRPVTFTTTVTVPAAPSLQSVSPQSALNGGGNKLTWTDPTPATLANLGNTANEQGFQIQRGTGAAGAFGVIATVPANTITFIDGTATAPTIYRYRVTGFNKTGSANSNTVQVTTAATAALPAVPNLALPGTSPAAGAAVNVYNPIPFSWGAITGATSYTLQILSGANVVVNMPGLISPSITLPNDLLVPGPYTWKVSATGPRGTSAFSAAIALIGETPPAAPTNLAASVMSATRVDLTWTDNSANETGFIVQRSPDGVAWANVVLGTNPTAANATTFSDTTVTGGNTYHYRVIGTNIMGNGPPSAEVVTTTVVPNPATGVTANAINPTTVTLLWSHASNENGFDVERAPQGSGTWAVLGTSPTVLAGVHTYTDTTAVPNTAYDYRVWPFNGIGRAATAVVVTITTPAVPAAPTLNSPTVNANHVNLSWVDNAVNEDGFVIDRAPEDTLNPGNPGTFAAIFTTAAHQTNYVDTPAVGGKYWYRVKAFWGVTFSTDSGSQSVTLTPAAPSALSANRTTSTNVALTWVDNASNEQGFIVQRAPESSPGSGVPGPFAQVGGTLPANTTSSSDTSAPMGTVYYYQVQAYAGTVNSAFSTPPTRVGLWTALPGRPAIPTQPANGATWGTNTPILNWYASSQAASYTVQVSTTTSFAALVVNQAGITDTFFTTPALAFNRLYYWRVSAQNDLGTSAQSATWSFRTATAATVPARPTQLYPANGATVPDQTPPLVWNPAAAATTYNVQVSTTTAFTTTVVNQTGITGTQLDVPVTLTLNGLYYWRVQAQNVTGVSLWSTTRSFRVSATSATAAPSTPVLLSPANAATAVGNMPVLYWYPAPGAANYTVQIATSTAFTTLLVNQTGVTGTSLTCPAILPAGIKYWRVSAQNANGTSANSASRSFTP